MNITIVQTFTDGFTTYQSGQELSVPSEVAQRWIADGTAQADTDGQQSWLSSTEVAATRALVSEDGPTAGHARQRDAPHAIPGGHATCGGSEPTRGCCLTTKAVTRRWRFTHLSAVKCCHRCTRSLAAAPAASAERAR